MSTTLRRVTSLLLPKSSNFNNETNLQPEIGFKILYNSYNNELIVKVIGGRHLPNNYGNIKPQGYLVKVRVFPGREKYETDIMKDSWPCFNQDFKFPLSSDSHDPFTGKFVSLTVYAVLDQQDVRPKLRHSTSFTEQVKSFISGKDDRRKSEIVKRNSTRLNFNNRRTIGVISYNLEKKLFTQNLKGKIIATPDVWRNLQNISSGVPTEPRESKKGSLEVTMTYSNSEDGKNDLIQISLSKWRCSMNTMEEHEKLGGSLYLKMVALECDVEVAKWKGDSFKPAISMKIEPKTATMQTYINSYNIDNVKIIIKIKSKHLTKKILLGTIEIRNFSLIWRQIVDSPAVPITQMIDFC